MKKTGRPVTTKPYRKNLVRFSYMEDAILEILGAVNDSKSQRKINKILDDLRDHEIQKVASKN